MVNVELYINNKLADTGRDFSIRLSRQLIDPNILASKDAQFSYAVKLPPTLANSALFNSAGVEEVSNKFNTPYTAELVVNGVRIFVGNFRLSEIYKGYKGNLYTPAEKTIKDVFGDLILNEIPEYRIFFEDFVDSVSFYNDSAKTKIQKAIFPYVLYGLLPKVPLDKNANNYSDREIWDGSVRLGMQDVPPSINTFKLIRHIFESAGLNISGSAFNESTLVNIYQSYKNAPEYVQPWNYGNSAKLTISGSWNSRYKGGVEKFEKGVNQSTDKGYNLYTTDLFDATNTELSIDNDPGGNVISNEVEDADGATWLRTQIRVPSSGFYRVKLGASVRLNQNENYSYTDPATGVLHVGGYSDLSNNSWQGHINEIRLVRDRRAADFGLQASRLNSTMCYDNLPQDGTFDESSPFKYFPKLETDRQINFIDLAQDPNHVLGFSFGIKPSDRTEDNTFFNPLEPTVAPLGAQVQAAKPSVSWDLSQDTENITRLAINSPGYMKFGNVGTDDTTDALGWVQSDKYKIELTGAPANYSKRGFFDGAASVNKLWTGQGEAAAVVWLDAGELLSVATVGSEGRIRKSGRSSIYGLVDHEVKFTLDLEAFRTNDDWLKVDFRGQGTEEMDFNDPINFDVDSINLAGFLPADMKVNDYLENIQKAFNLKLTKTGDLRAGSFAGYCG